MRQVGILAAAGAVAIETGFPRLAQDHARARRLAVGIEQLAAGHAGAAAGQGGMANAAGSAGRNSISLLWLCRSISAIPAVAPRLPSI